VKFLVIKDLIGTAGLKIQMRYILTIDDLGSGWLRVSGTVRIEAEQIIYKL
jgi:hypothetical protein